MIKDAWDRFIKFPSTSYCYEPNLSTGYIAGRPPAEHICLSWRLHITHAKIYVLHGCKQSSCSQEHQQAKDDLSFCCSIRACLISPCCPRLAIWTAWYRSSCRMMFRSPLTQLPGNTLPVIQLFPLSFKVGSCNHTHTSSHHLPFTGS